MVKARFTCFEFEGTANLPLKWHLGMDPFGDAKVNVLKCSIDDLH
jgi:hypothetical protein